MLGGRIRALREERGLSVRRLAAAASVSPALVSQVERGINDPSLDSLRRLAEALDVPLFDLFAEPREEHDLTVVRAADRIEVGTPGDVRYTRLSSGSGVLEVLEGVLEPGGRSSSEPWSHPAEECAVVTSGRLLVEVAGRRATLEAGDSCSFDSRRPHRYLNDGDERAVFVLSVTPPSW
ncbi:MAG: helix-turn-helix transcriptional regulator [Nocardioidaceae bacterium]|nr:helix-turn-helix transcriptional regulator [Nocardioidaceae bacterium]NUS51092.1 helix-turn-helix transcriptional regulator [Nocardioidaceae bacterium]